MLEETLETEFGQTSLIRPGANPKQPLRAWDAADEYLIEHIHQQLSDTPLVIFNDQFGALACHLNENLNHWVSDSFCAHFATGLNLKHNNTQSDNFNLSDCLKPLESVNKDSIALIKLPKNLSLLSHQLKSCEESGIKRILIAGMMKHLPKNILPFLQDYGDVNRLPFKKKATIFELAFDDKKASTQTKAFPYPKQNTFEGIQLSSHANVFGRDKLDIGALFFLQNIKKLPKAQNVADLCCGSGILGLKYAKLFGPATMDFYDESHMAVESSKESWQLNSGLDSTSPNFIWTDGMQQPDNSITPQYDLILCNPPFHEQHTVGDHIAKRLFKDAKQALNENGQLIVVGNRHLSYHKTLKTYFKKVETIASNNKFVLLSAKN